MKLTFVLIQTIYVFGFGVPLFIDADQGTGGKWGLWILHKLVLTGVYGLIVFMHHSRWRDRLPGKWLLFSLLLCVLKNLFLFCDQLAMILGLLCCSKTSILQLRMCNAATEWHIAVWMLPCCKWSWIWFMVRKEHFFQNLWLLIHL